MEQIITAKLKLHTTPEQRARLRQTQLAYRDALNHVSRHAFDQGKITDAARLQKATYADIRAQYSLPAQMACNVPRQVAATYKGLWSKAKANVTARACGRTKKRYKGLDKPPTYSQPTVTYSYGRDYGFKRGWRVSVLTLVGRLVLPYSGYNKHLALIREGATIGAAKLWYDKPKKRFYLLVSLAVTLPDSTPDNLLPDVVGVDLGQRYLAVATDTTGKAAFHSGKEVRQKANHLARVRKRLQQKGTRAATRRLVAIGQRERRQQAAANHTIARRIVDANPTTLIGVENLTHIRDRTGPRKRGEKASGKQRTANRIRSKWSFAETQALLAYKATLAGSQVVWVDANYTSQMCPRCGHTSRANRPHKGLLFVCAMCGYTLHADLIGARNVALRTLLIRQDWVSTGALSVRPDVSDGEAKATRLSRFAELRWSLETSPRVNA